MKDVQIGDGSQDFMHTIAAGSAALPPMVCIPGYGAGAAFYWRNLAGLGRVFRTYAVDLLGTGMSGGLLALAVALSPLLVLQSNRLSPMPSLYLGE